MKTISSVLGALTIAFFSASAQQMVSTPAQVFASPAPATDSTPEPVVSPAAEEREAVPSASRARSETSSSLPHVEKTKTAAAKPSSQAQPAVATGKKSVEATLKEMENKWEAAIVAHDASAVDALVAPDFSGISAKGKFVNKRALIGEIKRDKDTYTSARNEKLNVHVYGDTVAVVTGSAHSKGATKEGKPFDRTYRYTDTWVQRDGQWQCVASQDSILSEK